jgi:hypothetical protein
VALPVPLPAAVSTDPPIDAKQTMRPRGLLRLNRDKASRGHRYDSQTFRLAGSVSGFTT